MIGHTGLPDGGGTTGPTGGLTGAMGVIDGSVGGGGAIGPVGPAGPRGCVPLWHPQPFGGVSPREITAGTGTTGFTGAGRAYGAAS